MNIGNQIKNFRAEKRVTQEELAEYLNISAQAVSKWETNASTPDIALLPPIATFFGITIDELFALPKEEQYERIENMFWRERRIPQETFEQSVRFLQEQITKDSRNVRAYEDLAYLYNHRAASDHAEASEYAKKVIELDPDHKPGWVAFQEANNAVCGDEWYDNHFSVVEYCKSILQKYPDNYRALYTIIENLLADRRFDDAVPYIRKIGEVAPESQQMLFYSGDVAYGKGDVEEAKRLWNQGVEQYSGRWQAYCDRADRMKKLGYIEEAIADYEKCMQIQSKPRLTDGLYSLAQVHEQIGDYEAAIRDNERIIQILAEDYDTHSGESVDFRRREIERLRKIRGPQFVKHMSGLGTT
ncbi:MAG: helix-turn-helix domain-containing protein [Lachnospiraceae bacterium]|nr:helix-turn-helix domain-containing protein [Lachnospiraceae bacterium]